MQFNDIARLAFGALRQRRTRSALTIIGIAVGSSVILGLVASTEGLSDAIVGELDKFRATTIMVFPSDTAQLTSFDQRAIENYIGVKMVVPTFLRGATIKSGGKEENIQVMGVDMQGFREAVGGVELEDGRFLSLFETNGVVLGQTLAHPVGEDAPFAWIGVPLITSEQTIGRLALFSLTTEVEFSQDDLNLLTILSGQTTVAIEIALHNALLSSDITIGRDRLTTILNSVRDGLILINPDGRITLINEAVNRLTGLPQSEFIGHVLKDLPPDVIETIGFTIQEAGELQERIHLDEFSVFNKHSYTMVNRVPELIIERSLIPVDGESEQLAGLIILLRDITDEYKIKQAQNLISETLVHDLRSPLSSTISALDVIHDSFLSGDPAGIVEPSIQIAQRSSRRMLAMVESILEITRMESGNIELSLSKVNIETLLEESVSEFTTVALEYEVSISVKSPSDLPLVRMDKNKIHRVLNNLIDNALKYTPKNVEILITAGIHNQELLEIRVIDSGPGIPKEYQKRIFERFAQIPGMASRKRGSGLGLTYCHLAIEAHRGKIWVEDNPGGGSVFIFTLLVAGPDEQGD